MALIQTLPPLVPRRARFDAQAYFDMAALLQSQFAKTELRDGVIYEMPADGPLATLWNSAVSRWLHNNIRDDLLIVTDKSLRLGEDWVPSPDHYVCTTPLALEKAMPEAVLLVIEVADTTLESDLGEKAEAYARGGIREYWVIDPREKCLYLHRLNEQGHYGRPRVIAFTESVTASLIPGLTLTLSELPRIS